MWVFTMFSVNGVARKIVLLINSYIGDVCLYICRNIKTF